MRPFFSIIMPVFLGDYKGAAKDRKTKFIRAVMSVLNQVEQNFELIIVSDNCIETIETCGQFWSENKRIKYYYLWEKQAHWNGQVRNAGLRQATGKYIMYLDSDDFYTVGYLAELKFRMKDNKSIDWFTVNELRWNIQLQDFDEFIPTVGRLSQIGTSNIIHKIEMKARWEPARYGYDDYNFSNSLRKESKNFIHLNIAGYCVCHIPGRYEI